MKQNGVFFAIAPVFRGKLGFEDAQIVPSRCVEQHRSRIVSEILFILTRASVEGVEERPILSGQTI